jgi:hypothetical protein
MCQDPLVPLMKPLLTRIDRSREQLLDPRSRHCGSRPWRRGRARHRRVDQIFSDSPTPGISRTSPQTFRDRVLHIRAMITTTGSRVRIHLDATTCYATTIAACGWTRLRHAFT